MGGTEVRIAIRSERDELAKIADRIIKIEFFPPEASAAGDHPHGPPIADQSAISEFVFDFVEEFLGAFDEAGEVFAADLLASFIQTDFTEKAAMIQFIVWIDRGL